MVRALIVGATRGLGSSLAKRYAAQASDQVIATARSSIPKDFPDSIKWLSNIDLLKPNVGDELTNQLKGENPLDIVVRNSTHIPITPNLGMASSLIYHSRSSPLAASPPKTSVTKAQTGTSK